MRIGIPKYLNLKSLEELKVIALSETTTTYTDTDLAIAWELFDRLTDGRLK